MSVEHLLAFNVALLAALASPGPALLFAIRTTLSNGRRAGAATGCGLGAMAATWTLLALLGLESAFRLFPWAYAVLKIVGACYLLYIAWTTWRGASDPIAESTRPTLHAFRDGVLVNLANPKSVVFAAAVLIVIFPPGLTLAEKGLIVANHFVIEVLSYGGLAFMLSTHAVSRRYLRAKSTLDRVAAIVLGGLGLRLMADR